MSDLLRKYAAWLWLIGALALIAVIQAVGAGRPARGPDLSVRSGETRGALGAYEWLGRLGYFVERATSGDLGLAGSSPRNTTLVLLQTGLSVTGTEADTVSSWVSSGGRLVIASDGRTGAELASRYGVYVMPTFPQDIRVVQPLLQAPPVLSLDGGATAYASVSRASVAARVGDSPALSHLRVGAGDVWLLTAPYLLDNESLNHADNWKLLLNLVGSPGRTVIFDEYAGATSAGGGAAADWFGGSSWGAMALVLVVILVLYRWMSGIRLGPAVVPLADNHRPLTEYVVSLGGLLRRGRKRKDVLETYQRQLRRELVDRFGVESPDALPRDVRDPVEPLLQTPQRLDDAELVRRAEEIVKIQQDLRRHSVRDDS